MGKEGLKGINCAALSVLHCLLVQNVVEELGDGGTLACLISSTVGFLTPFLAPD